MTGRILPVARRDFKNSISGLIVHVDIAGCVPEGRKKLLTKKAGSAEMALSTIGKLYKAETERDLYRKPEEFAAARRRIVEPILVDFRTWLERRVSQVPPETLLGKAVGYALTQWPKLIRYLDHPVLTPDTNACENAIRPFVVGRRNWLFSGSPRGAAASATLYGLIETAKANRQEPYWYLRKLFDGLPAARAEAEVLSLSPLRSTEIR